VFAEQEQEAHLRSELLSHPIGDVRAVHVPQAAELVEDGFDLELSRRYFVHRQIV